MTEPPGARLRVGVLASGSGTNLQALLDTVHGREAEVVAVASDKPGARALERGHLLEHLYREVRAPRIYEGASEVQREIIARELFKEAEGR